MFYDDNQKTAAKHSALFQYPLCFPPSDNELLPLQDFRIIISQMNSISCSWLYLHYIFSLYWFYL